jgi:hypothetical protein
MSENVGASTSHNSIGLHDLYRNNLNFYLYYNLLAFLSTAVEVYSCIGLTQAEGESCCTDM